MEQAIASPHSAPPLPISSADEATEALLQQHQRQIWRSTDRLMCWLLHFEWLLGITLAICRTPLTWQGSISRVHPHVWAAIFLGGIIVSLPVMLVLFQCGTRLSRHTIAAGQMLMSAMLVYLGDGRVEMHFHIFGSLAFLAFYRDWKVLITATVAVVLFHLIGGIYLPESVYGVASAPLWRTFEHGGWVLFEDLFLVGSCMKAVQEMHGIALNRALLEHTYQDVERQVVERTAELKNAQESLMKSARSAGMAEIATSVLHNVGNVLNSVNVSATLVTDKLHQSEIPTLGKVSSMMQEHETDLGEFLTTDERGKMIPGFIADLAGCLGEEQATMLSEVESLSKGIEHIKQIVAAQQSMAKSSQVQTRISLPKLIETALTMHSDAAAKAIQTQLNIAESADVLIDQHKVLQILINLLSNARHAVLVRPADQRRVTIDVDLVDAPQGRHVRFQVGDNGMGIAPENLTKVFAHGFTTKKDGHGFGLHSAANAAREMGGTLTVSSEGPNKGAQFTLELPVSFVSEETACNP